ncbi:uncharacterized protein BX664DRAFT_98596 [Halteromyces radiatus]|uniref:uncharacterized protein n=1 Tax=Halteromyces radiatus TaxID=101107 RepID=UPI002220C78E|nr:uncharacterized protein BX664DRAFT_98596 [Halteromyces radiatus]KAI8092993.1 hypothetical protein BX664DRAFT_98596 [Halteromyces radiatus]
MAMMNNWISPNLITLQQDPWKYGDPNCTTPIFNNINYYGQNVSYHHHLQQQQQQQQQYTEYSGQSRKQHHPHSSRTNHQSSRKSRSAPMNNTHFDSRISSTPIPKSTTPHRRVRSSTLNSTSSSTTENTSKQSYRQSYHNLQPSSSQSHPNLTSLDQRRSNSPCPSLADDSGTWRSSIYSHTSSVKTVSDTTSFTNAPLSSSSSSVSSMSKTNKPSLSKRIRGVFTGTSNNKPQHETSSLRRSPSLASCASSVSTTRTLPGDTSSFRSSWTNLFRKTSKSVSVSSGLDELSTTTTIASSTNQKDITMHVDPRNVGNPLSRNASPKPTKYYYTDLPSPALSSTTSDSSSTPPSSLLSAFSVSSPNHHHHHVSNKHVRSSPKSDLTNQQQEYFGVPPSSRLHPATTFLQHGSPVLRPSSNIRQSSNSSLVSTDDDDLSLCMTDSVSTLANDNNKSGMMTLSLSGPYGKRINSSTTKTVSTGNKGSKVRFRTTVQVHDTFGSQDYDRRCDTQATCQRLTPTLALQIKQELNEYKLNEMQVHPQSRQYTHFFL